MRKTLKEWQLYLDTCKGIRDRIYPLTKMNVGESQKVEIFHDEAEIIWDLLNSEANITNCVEYERCLHIKFSDKEQGENTDGKV